MNPNYTTDGPWSSDSEFISAPDGLIAQVVERDTPRETEANGRLIASAPLLLAVLQQISDDLEAWSDSGDSELFHARMHANAEDARAIISKAIGGNL
jgi:hypothetical protein